MHQPLICSRCQHSSPTVATVCPACGTTLSAQTTGGLNLLPTSDPPADELNLLPTNDHPGFLSGPAGTPARTTLPQPLSQPSHLALGTRLGRDGRYHIESLIGRGGFAETYLAYDSHLFDAPCVVKHLVLPQGDEHHQLRLATLEHEARLLVQLKTPGHPNIPEVYEYLAETRCLVMKYVAGRSLRDLLRSRPSGMAEDDVLRLAQSTCGALAYMHARGVLHLDLKPDNLLYEHDTAHLWVIDFGIGQNVERAADVSPSFGTRGYTPREQWRGQPTETSDVYALAATMCALLTREPPELDGTIPPSAAWKQIRPELRQLITLGLAVDPVDRPTAQEFLGELDGLIAPEHIPPPPAPRVAPQPRDPVGRTAELAVLEQQLQQEHSVVLSGIAGVGKTTLAALLARVQERRCRIFWHTFHPGEDGAVVIWHLAAFLARQGYGDLWRLHHRAAYNDSPERLLELRCDYAVQALINRSFLVCLDDLHLVEDDAIVQRLIAGLRHGWQRGPGGLVLVSRHAPPGLRGASPPPLQGLSPSDTVALLSARGLALADGLATQLHQRTDGNAQLLTLAIDALLGTTAPARLIERLASTTDIERFLLREVDGGLSDAERSVLEAASVLLSYGGSRDALAATLAQPIGRRTLHELVRRNLLVADSVDGAPEYGLHAIVQAFYYDELDAGTRHAMHLRAAAHYESAEPRRLLAARHYTRAGAVERAATLATADIWGAVNAGQARPLIAVLDEIQVAALAAEVRLKLLLARGDVLTLLREGEKAQTAYATAIAELEGPQPVAGSAALVARGCRGMASLLEYESPEEALAWLQRGLAALPIDDAANDERARLQHRLGSVLLGHGDVESATEALGAALASLPEGEERLRADILVNLGVIHCEQGDTEAGAIHFREAQSLYRRLGHRLGLAAVLQNLGMIADYGGDWPAAEAAYREALGQAEQTGDVNRQSSLRLSLGTLATQRGWFDQARVDLEAALQLAARHGLAEYLVAAGASLTELHLRAGEIEAASAALTAAERAADERGGDDQRAELVRLSAALALARGEAASAAELATQALDLAGDDQRETGLALRVRGQAALALGNTAGLDDLAASAALLDEVDPYETARTKMTWGEALIAHRDSERGEVLVRAAEETLTRLMG